MPYKKFYRKRKTYKKKPISVQALALAKANRKKIIRNRPELKIRDKTFSSSLIARTTAFYWCDVDRGDAEFQRVGDEINVEKLHQQIYIDWNPSINQEVNRVRIINVVWHENGNFDTDMIVNTTDDPRTFLETTAHAKYKVLSNDLVQLDVNRKGYYLQHHIPFKGKISYDGATGVEFTNNMIYTIIIMESVSYPPTVHILNRLRYTDP